MTAREEILARVRRAVGERPIHPQLDYAAIERHYQTESNLPATERVELFIDRLHDYNATVYRCAPERIAETVARSLAERGRRRIVIPHNFPSEWLRGSFEYVDGTMMTYEELDRSDGVLTGCAVAIASTGTIVLQHGDGEGRRALTLIPDYHLCIVLEDQIVGSVPEGIRAMSAFPRVPLTTVSGPSATSDIEMTRVKGVHGPRMLDVIMAGRTAPRNLL